MTNSDEEMLKRIYEDAYKRKLQEVLDAELEEERAFFEIDDDGFVITKNHGPGGYYPGEHDSGWNE